MQNDSTALNLLMENTAFENAYIKSGGILNDVIYNGSTNQYGPDWDFEGLDSETHQLRADDVSNCWLGWQLAKQNNFLFVDCMIDQTWFMKGSPVANLIKHAEGVYKAEAIAQNSNIQFGTDDNKTWWAHDVPFFGTVQLDQIEEHDLIEWDIHFNECWQGPFSSKSKAIQHLEECIAEKRQEVQEQKPCVE
ncbi:hypothetical protein ACINWC323_3240 [Acinetobacter sp. WC-323]|uniref:hypothetical protein n=1 Tax=Acinetobacter sp. WC-323 TaxID=903918 RepID=UPI00029E15D3|nr:hypothetical protein [Acinetobacter sp. WC-323]EKU54505.1 hypothetical protein ACINWC323_3240 [Acinetobacter sp. WC-323]